MTTTNTAAANLPGTRAKGPLHAVHADQAVRAALLAFHARPADDEAAAVVAVIGAALAAPAQREPTELQVMAITTAYEQGVGKGNQAQSSGEEITNPYDKGWRCDQAWRLGYEEGKEQAARKTEPAAPALAGEYPADTGNPEADRIIGRLAASDPDFDDCAAAVALIYKLVAEHKGPVGFATWKDAAVAEHARRAEATRTQATTEHPPLPRHDWCLNCSPAMPGYTADQMRAYVDADRAARGASQAADANQLDMDRVLSIADVHADESREDGVRLIDRNGLVAFASDVLRAATPAADATTLTPRAHFITGWDAARMYLGMQGSVDSDAAMRKYMVGIPSSYVETAAPTPAAAAPVVLPEPAAAQSRFTETPSDTWDSCSVEHARSFGGAGYEVRYLFTEQQVRALLATGGQAQAAPYSLDLDPLGIRALTASAITGALSFGATGGEKPPAGHWLEWFYQAGAEKAPQGQADARDASWLTTEGRAHGFRVMQDISGAVITHSTDSLRAAIAAAKGEQP